MNQQLENFMEYLAGVLPENTLYYLEGRTFSSKAFCLGLDPYCDSTATEVYIEQPGWICMPDANINFGGKRIAILREHEVVVIDSKYREFFEQHATNFAQRNNCNFEVIYIPKE